MDSAIKFYPLWDEVTMMGAPIRELHDIRRKMLEKFITDYPEESQLPPSTEDVIKATAYLLQAFLWDASEKNTILVRIRSVAQRVSQDPAVVVQRVIHLWYRYAAPVLGRTPPRNDEEDIEAEEPEPEEKDIWIPYYGHLSMLLLADVWEQAEHPKLQTACLVANATISILFAVYTITSKLELGTLRDAQPVTSQRAMQVFLRTAWQVARQGWKNNQHPPASEFGAHLTEVRLTTCGKDLQSKVGLKDWKTAPYWHPARKVPGSHWNKFMRNRKQPVFPTEGHCPPGLHFKVPSSVLALMEPWETYYEALKDNMDLDDIPRKKLTRLESCDQFAQFSAETGNSYPRMRPDEQTATGVWEVPQEYLDASPMLKKPSMDLAGNITPAFMTTTARGLRYQEEPEEIEADFFVMTFDM